ncbi:ectoderm-neural cortex protein 1-like isoform X1 [Strix uralensis]
MAAGALSGLVAVLETYRGRDRVVRALCYGCQLAGGALAGPQAPPSGLPGSLLAVSAQLSACRTALRLFDDFAMLSYSCGYGLGPKDEDSLVRGLSVLCNLASQLYYPCEHVAWAADAGIIPVGSRKWWTLSTALWAVSLLLGILRSLRILFQLRRKLRQHKRTSSPQSQQEMKAQVKAEVLSVLTDAADLANAIHWLPPGFLWAGRFPPWLSTMSVSSHENRKSRSSSGSMNIHLFHKPGHADSLLTHLNLLRKRHLFTDAVLRAGNQTFHCHRAVLASCSRYFDAMFSGGLKESRDAEVNFHDSLHPEVLELLLDYAYSARVLINEENAESLLEAGDMLQFQDIRDASADFLEKNLYPGNCLNMLLLSDAHCCERLLELSWRMALANFTSLCKTEDFLRLPKDKLLELVESEELEVEDETLVYEAVIGWIRYDLPRRHEVLPELLRSVRLALLPESYLRKQVACEKLVTSHKLGEEIVADAVRCKMKILQNDGLVTGCCARPRKVSQALLLLGGQTFMCDKIYMLDHKTSEIIPRADIPSPRKECSACAIGCKVYITGGKGSENGASKDVWVYDTLHDEWAKAAPMLVARFGHGSAELDHCLYVVGGHTAVSGAFPASPSVSLKQVEHYDPQLDKWSLVAPLREGVSNAAVVGAKMKLFVFGGTSANQEKLPKVQCFDPCQNRWTVPASCPQPWRYTAAAVVGSHIIVIGGDTEFSASSAYRFHSDTFQWSKFGDVTAKRISCRAVTSGNRLYVVGGYCGAQRCKTLDCYDPSSDTWSSVTTVPYSLIPTAFVSTWKYLSA